MTSENPTDREELRQRLRVLQSEHRDLDDVISRLLESGSANQLQMQRLKKRKLILKDQINYFENEMLPDIIA